MKPVERWIRRSGDKYWCGNGSHCWHEDITRAYFYQKKPDGSPGIDVCKIFITILVEKPE